MSTADGAAPAGSGGRAELTRDELRGLSPAEVRALIRAGEYSGFTWGLAPDHVQATIVCLPAELALEFMIFAQRNPASCPILEVTEPGDPIIRRLAPGADVRTDVPRYRIVEHGRVVAEPADLRDHWRPDLVTFLIGTSSGFEPALRRAGVRLRHLEEGKIGTDLMTSIECVPAGRFRGRVAVSMRPIHWAHVARAVQVTSRFPAFHGAPVHVGDPIQIGITDLGTPVGGEVLDVRDDEVAVFWDCSVTPLAVALQAKLELMIGNVPGCLLMTDALADSMAVIG